MVVSSYENIAKKDELDSSEAGQLGETISRRVEELNLQSRRQIEDLPEYQKLGIDNIGDLGDELSDLMSDKDEYLKAFALMKNPTFAELMESTEPVHRSFSNMMQDNGDEKLMFGALEMLQSLRGLDSVKNSNKQQTVDIKV